MCFEPVDVVHGRTIVRYPGAELRSRAAAAARVTIDLGAGDGRLAYRLAHAHSDWLCVAVDACAAALRRLSSRAGRKPGRGGAPNAVFIRAAVDSLPDALEGIADEITVHYPWASLLRALVEPDPAVLRAIARAGRPGAKLRVRLNVSALVSARVDVGAFTGRAESTLRCGYAAGGIRLDACGLVVAEAETSWSARVHQGRPATVLAIDGTLTRLEHAPESEQKDPP